MEEEMKNVLKDLFKKCGIAEEKQEEVIDKLFESKVIYELMPEIKCNILELKVEKRGNRGCLIFDGKYFYILPYEGRVFDCTPDRNNIEEDFLKFENNEEI